MASSTRIGSHALAALLPDPTSSGARRGAVYAAIAEALSALVLDGRIAVGTRVPSERELAAALGLSRTTVTAAYSTLRADGYLTSQTGSGSFTAVPAGTTASSSTVRWAPPGAPPDLIDLTCATPAGPAVAIPTPPPRPPRTAVRPPGPATTRPACRDCARRSPRGSPRAGCRPTPARSSSPTAPCTRLTYCSGCWPPPGAGS